jgi:hypothetical protein
MIWEKYLFGIGTPDDWRNPFWRVTEKLSVIPLWSKYLFDLRIGFKKSDKWIPIYLKFWKDTTQNFQNGIFTINFYITRAKFHWGWAVIYAALNTILWFLYNLIAPEQLIYSLSAGIIITASSFFFHPRINLVIRPLFNWWFQFGCGILFDRGEFGIKLVGTKWSQDCSSDAIGYNEGSV